MTVRRDLPEDRRKEVNVGRVQEVDQDLGRLEQMTEDARRVAADDGPADPEMFREAVRESEAALRSAHSIRSRLLGAYKATQGRA